MPYENFFPMKLVDSEAIEVVVDSEAIEVADSEAIEGDFEMEDSSVAVARVLAR